MYKIIPQRKLKNRLRLLFILIVIFIATVLVCMASAFVAGKFTSHIISPLSHLVAKIHNDSSVGDVQQACKKENLSCNDISLQKDDSVTFTLDGGTHVILSTKKSITEQLASLQKVASQLTIKDKRLKQVDFRFDTIVVSF